MALDPYKAVKACWEAAGLENCSLQNDGSCIIDYSTGTVVYEETRKACQNSGVLVTGFDLMPRGALIVAYTLWFIWLFFGISIASDAFSQSIEVITSATKKVIVKDRVTGEERIIEKPVWNWVVANITLMACGSSAPEILLTLIETLLDLGKAPGNLGPSCIVGSGTFNFFAISALCTLSLPAGQTKRVEQFRVFITTATWSIWAHVWMYLVYEKISPNVVDLWEALVTLGFMVLLVLSAWIMDIQPWKNNQVAAMSSEGTASIVQMELDDIAQTQRKSILYYRMLAVRQMAGETKTKEMIEMGNGTMRDFGDHYSINLGMSLKLGAAIDLGPEVCKVCFSAPHYSVLESHGSALVTVRRYDGDLDQACSVSYITKDWTAIAGVDYDFASGVIIFAPGEVERVIEISIIDDDMAEPDVTLQVVLSNVKAHNTVISQETADVTIVDDDDSGMLSFELPTYEAGNEDSHVEVAIIRRHGVDGTVTVDYGCKEGSASINSHFVDTSGTLTFGKGESRVVLAIPLIVGSKVVPGQLPAFKIVLSNPLGGAVLGKRTECRIIITPGKSKHHTLHPEGQGAKEKEEGEFNLREAWTQQFKDAVMPRFDLESDSIWVDLMLHYISITWKLLLSIVPPPEWKGGYPCFFSSLACLVGIIVVLKDVANLWGCAVGLSQLMTGMSIVALGTSLPDSFASRYAAIHDDTADSAIGNIMGSNSVNVFLGLGLPWTVAAIYYNIKGVQYVVDPGALPFSLVVFLCLFGGGLGWMMRDRYTGGELGGLPRKRYISASIYLSCYMLFQVLVGTNDYGHLKSSLNSGASGP